MTVTTLPQRGRIDPSTWPTYPPSAWFDPPTLDDLPGDMYVHLDTEGPNAGRVRGWLHHAGSVLLRGDDIVWTPAPSPTGLHDCQLGQTPTAEGSVVRTANVGGGVNHARLSASFREAIKHYENTASQLMRVRYHQVETPNGPAIAYSGAVWPDVSERDVLMLMASGLSGDWRWRPEYNEFDLTGAQLVNSPGLPLRRVASLDGPDVILGPGGLCEGEACCVSCTALNASLDERVLDVTDALATLAVDGNAVEGLVAGLEDVLAAHRLGV